MITTDIPTVDVFIAALSEFRLIASGPLDRVRAWRLASPSAKAEALADFLVEQEYLTRFQADTLLTGDPKTLSLSVYSLIDVLGSGSMGTVYKAISVRDQNLYAIKVVPRRNVVSLKTLASKIEALKQVRHPRVSALVHVGAQGDRAYMVWPFLEGGEKLDAIVRRQKQLAVKPAAQIALQIAAGLQAYHEHGLFHGLLKPSDVLMGADRRVRLLDFGVGFLLTCDRGKALLDTMTNSKALARGLDCASPEAILDPLNRTVLGDQYSLGCILYYCLAGRYPFTEQNPVKKMLAHQCQEPTPIRQLVPDCPPRLAKIVQRLLQKQPEDRYQDIGELIDELQTITSDSRHPVSSGPQPSPAPGVQQEEKNAQRPTEPPEPIKQNSQAALWLILGGMVAGGIGGYLAWMLAQY